jgi:hypothetical protein
MQVPGSARHQMLDGSLMCSPKSNRLRCGGLSLATTPHYCRRRINR